MAPVTLNGFRVAKVRSGARGCRRRSPTATHASSKSSTGLGLLEWAGENTQGTVVKLSKFVWKEIWRAMVRELAPQAKGSYSRPSDPFISEGMELGDIHYLYTGNACPWCHRCHFQIHLQNLAGVEVVRLDDDAERASRGGWIIMDGVKEPLFNAKDLKEVYDQSTNSENGFRGRCTAPLLINGRRRKIVSNNSKNIMKLLNDLSLKRGEGAIDLFPKSLEREIERLEEWMFKNLNNAVYQAGFSTTQEACEAAAAKVFDALGTLEASLASQKYLLGERITGPDLMLLPTLCRFDAVYSVLFKCSKRRIIQYPSLTKWMQRMFALPGSFETYNLQAAVESYYLQLFPLNPSGVVPFGPSWKEMGIDPTKERLSRTESLSEFHVVTASSP